jgi:hypothetical protein
MNSDQHERLNQDEEADTTPLPIELHLDKMQ